MYKKSKNKCADDLDVQLVEKHWFDCRVLTQGPGAAVVRVLSPWAEGMGSLMPQAVFQCRT